MPTRKDSKHEAFLRLAETRGMRTLEQLRLMRQLFNPASYEFTPQEATEIIEVLDTAVLSIAEAAGVRYATRIGNEAATSVHGASGFFQKAAKTSVMDAVEIAKTIEQIKAGNTDEALTTLSAALERS